MLKDKVSNLFSKGFPADMLQKGIDLAEKVKGLIFSKK